MADKNAQLSINASAAAIELPIYEGTIGPDVIDVRGLTAQGSFTYDPGFVSTASCESKITYIDGGAGILLHRGYPIDELAEHSDYLETCYLLLFGELPNSAQKQDFEATIGSNTQVNEQISQILKGFASDSHPMAKLMAMVSALSGYYHADIDIDKQEDRLTAAYRLIAQMPTLAAMCYKHGREEAYVAPRSDLGYGANFLHMMFGKPGSDEQPSPVLAKAVDKVFLLHADHEQNASTSTVRLAGSTGTSPFAAITAGIAALWGPAHGGANEAVLVMLDEIGGEENIEAYVAKAKDKNDPFRLMGFGHRVYKNYDPRATVMKKACDDVLQELNLLDDPMFRMAKKLEKIALEDEYFIEKKLFPNVDFYSGIILKALGIPTDMFTVIFALGRAPGWIAHWHEMLSAAYKIGRPRQLYTGPATRSFVALEKR